METIEKIQNFPDLDVCDCNCENENKDAEANSHQKSRNISRLNYSIKYLIFLIIVGTSVFNIIETSTFLNKLCNLIKNTNSTTLI